MLARRRKAGETSSHSPLATGLAYALLILASYKLQSMETGKDTALDPQVARASTPLNVPARSWADIAKAVFNEMQKDRVTAVAGGVTYFGLLALFPTITALVSFYGLYNDRAQAAADLSILSTMIPAGTFSIIEDQVKRIVSGDGVALSFAGLLSIALALWSSNSGMKAMMDALNVAHGVPENRPFLKLNAVSLLFTVSAMVFFLAMIAVIAIVPAILNFFWLGAWAEGLIRFGRWPAVIIVIGLGLSVLYRWGPDLPDGKWRWISPGSVLATLLLVILSIGFSFYAENFGKFNETYGTLGAVIAFMTWLWMSCIVILLGGELNAEMDRRSRA